jgi:hypothetical protein
MFHLPETHTVTITIQPVTKAGNVAAVAVFAVQVDVEYLGIEPVAQHEWRLTPTGKLGRTIVTATADGVVASVELQIVTSYRLEFVFEQPTEKVKLVAPDRSFTVVGNTIEVDAEHGVLNYINKVDLYGHAEEVPREELTAKLCQPPTHGHVELEESDGSFIYFV